MANLVSFVILVFFFYGRSLRYSNRARHIKVMSTVIAADVILITYLVVGRNALGKINPAMSFPLSIHVTFAITTVLLYFAAIYVGIRLVKGEERFRPAMRKIDHLVVPCRVLTLVTSLYLQVMS